MRDSSNLHQKIQDMCDCYATNDPLKEMSRLQHDSDTEEAAIKWIAMAVLHGINNNASEISIAKTATGDVKVVAEYRRTELPPPGDAVSGKIIQDLKEIVHLDSAGGESTLAFGFRNNSMDLTVKTREEGGDERVTISFP
jgi:hypothetical protein